MAGHGQQFKLSPLEFLDPNRIQRAFNHPASNGMNK